MARLSRTTCFVAAVMLMTKPMTAQTGDLQLAVPAIGDRGNKIVLDAFEKAARANGPRDRRFRVGHAQVVVGPDIQRFEALGVVASIQPS